MMTNRERYKQAFSVLQSSENFTLEAEEIKQIQGKRRRNMAIVAAAACAVVISCSGTVYAADIGGIREKVSMWLNGTEIEADVEENENGEYIFTYEEDGEERSIGISIGVASGGGLDENGNEVHPSADEIVSRVNDSAGVNVDENGKIWVCLYDQKVEITDSFDKDGVCNLTLTHEDRIIDIEVTKETDEEYQVYQVSQTERTKERMPPGDSSASTAPH